MMAPLRPVSAGAVQRASSTLEALVGRRPRHPKRPKQPAASRAVTSRHAFAPMTSRLATVARRRGWVLVLAVIGGLLGAVLVSMLQSVTYTAGATLLVSTDDSFDSTRLAQTYATALTDDGGMLRAVSAALGVDEDRVAESLGVEADDKTAVMRLEYRAESESDALRGATAAVRAVTGESPRALSIPPDVLEVIRAPRITASPSTGISPTSLVVGGILGLFLGVVLAMGLERSDRRIDSTDDLSSALGGTPATALRRGSNGLTPALVERWSEIARTSPPSVAMVSSRGLDASALQQFAATGDHASDLAVVVGGPVGTDGNAELVAQQADMAVMAVPRGARQREVEADVALLEQFGVSPRWGLLAG